MAGFQNNQECLSFQNFFFFFLRGREQWVEGRAEGKEGERESEVEPDAEPEQRICSAQSLMQDLIPCP